MTVLKTDKQKREVIKNNSTYRFDWVAGDPKSNIVIENKKLNVKIRRYLIKQSNGDILYDSLGIKEPSNNSVAIIINQKGEIGLIREWRPIPAKWFWACVRGFGDPNDENRMATAKRETIEEIGDCTIICSKNVGELYLNTTFSEKPVGLVLINVQNEEIQQKDLSLVEGIHDFKYFPLKKVMKMIKKGSIKDAFTLSALIKYISLID